MSASWVYIDGDVALGLLGLLGPPLAILLVVVLTTARTHTAYRESVREQRERLGLDSQRRGDRRRPGYIYGRR